MLLKGVVALAVAVAFDLAVAVAATNTFQIFDVYIYIDMYIYIYTYVYIFIDTCYFVSCFSVIQRMPLGDIPVTIWLDAVIFSRSFATLVSLLSLMIFASGDVVCAVHEYGPSLRHEGHLTLIREQKVYLRFLRIWRTTSVTGN